MAVKLLLVLALAGAYLGLPSLKPRADVLRHDVHEVLLGSSEFPGGGLLELKAFPLAVGGKIRAVATWPTHTNLRLTYRDMSDEDQKRERLREVPFLVIELFSADERSLGHALLPHAAWTGIYLAEAYATLSLSWLKIQDVQSWRVHVFHDGELYWLGECQSVAEPAPRLR